MGQSLNTCLIVTFSISPIFGGVAIKIGITPQNPTFNSVISFRAKSGIAKLSINTNRAVDNPSIVPPPYLLIPN
jgi:hypothetical protein